MMNVADVSAVYGGDRRRFSLLLLVAVNLLPLFGVLILDWDVAALMVLYWSENLVVGFYTLAKMLLTSPVGGLFSAIFFCIHYGGFCAVHGMFILTMLVNPDAEIMSGEPWPFFLVFIQMLVSVVQQVLQYAPSAWLIAFAGLWLSHGLSFVLNFWLGGEREALTVRQLMAQPYSRIVILHVAVLLGGIAVVALGQPLGMLLVLVLIKVGVDVVLHLREHARQNALR